MQDEQAVLQRVLFRLTARRGVFAFLPKLGSELHTLSREKSSARQGLCAQYVAQALEDEEVTVTDVVYTEKEGRAQVKVCLEWQGHSAAVTVQVGEVTDENGR